MAQMTLRNELAALVSVDRDNKGTEKVTKKNVTSDKNVTQSEKNNTRYKRYNIFCFRHEVHSYGRPQRGGGGGGGRVDRRPLWKTKKKFICNIGGLFATIFLLWGGLFATFYSIVGPFLGLPALRKLLRAPMPIVIIKFT